MQHRLETFRSCAFFYPTAHLTTTVALFDRLKESLTLPSSYDRSRCSAHWLLGAGKTTLLNPMLSHEYGQKVAVIVNEVGEVGIDHQIDPQLVVNTDPEIFEMNSGCICCTGRSDLIPMIGNLMNGSTSLITWSLKRRGWQILRP